MDTVLHVYITDIAMHRPGSARKFSVKSWPSMLYQKQEQLTDESVVPYLYAMQMHHHLTASIIFKSQVCQHCTSTP